MTKGKPWKFEEERKLKELLRANKSVRVIAKSLGKTRKCIRMKIARLGLEVVVGAKTDATTTTQLIPPAELPSVEEALKKLNIALLTLESPGLDQAEVLRLRSIISGVKIYKELYADYLDYRDLEAEMIELKEKFSEIAKNLREK
jgi:hypothetical protein